MNSRNFQIKVTPEQVREKFRAKKLIKWLGSSSKEKKVK
jgi:hypothetical protein